MIARRALGRSIVALVAACSLCRGALAAEWATDTPAATITSLQQGLVAAAKKSTVAERFGALEPLIAATHNLPYIAEFALRRQWASLSEADRQRFVAAFQRLSVMTYAVRFATVGAETFRPVSAAAAPDSAGRVEVSTAVARAGQSDVTLEYLLQNDADHWRIVNIVADGVSDLALKRAEYQRLYMSGGLEGLLAELEEQTKRLQQ
jgi:phospholipid transport system substrate-binding protein